MPSDRKHHKDPPLTEAPRDYTPSTYTRRGLKRAATAAAVAGLTGFTYALLPMAFAVGGAALGIWYVGAKFYEWLDAGRDDEPLRS
jgi:hypothetical protein